MSLHYDLRSIPESTRVVTDEDGAESMSPITNVLIWACGFVIGLHEITEANADEVFTRMAMVERAQGAWLRDGKGNDHPITLADIRAHVGLSTNGVRKTKLQFVKDLARNLREDAHRELDRQAEELDKAKSKASKRKAKSKAKPRKRKAKAKSK